MGTQTVVLANDGKKDVLEIRTPWRDYVAFSRCSLSTWGTMFPCVFCFWY